MTTEKFMVYEDDDRTALLRNLVAEKTHDGECMGELPRCRADMVWDLKQQGRLEEARAVEAIDDFYLRGTDDGLVRIHVLSMQRMVRLIDMGESKEGNDGGQG